MSNIKKYCKILDDNHHLFQKDDCHEDQCERCYEGYYEENQDV